MMADNSDQIEKLNKKSISYEDWVTKKQTTRRNSSVCLSISELPEQNNLKVKNGPTYDEWLKRKITYHRNSTASNDIEQIKLLLANRRDSVSSSNKNAESYDEWIKRKNKDRRNSSSLPDLSSDVQKASAGRRQSVNSHSHEGSSRKGLSHKEWAEESWKREIKKEEEKLIDIQKKIERRKSCSSQRL